MLGLYTLNTQTPLISVIYEDANTTEEPKSDKMAHFIHNHLHDTGAAQVTCTHQELALARRLLRLNSAKVAPEYESSLAPDERGFRRSFFVPISPLDSMQIGKITHNSGCTVCGSADAKACSGCKIERYCSSGRSLQHSERTQSSHKHARLSKSALAGPQGGVPTHARWDFVTVRPWRLLT